MLYRVFRELQADGRLKAEDCGRGRHAAVYRQLDFENDKENG